MKIPKQTQKQNQKPKPPAGTNPGAAAVNPGASGADGGDATRGEAILAVLAQKITAAAGALRKRLRRAIRLPRRQKAADKPSLPVERTLAEQPPDLRTHAAPVAGEPTPKKAGSSSLPPSREPAPTLTLLPVEQLRRAPAGVRRDFRDSSLLALADSIRLHGLLEPLLVRPTGDPAAPFAILSGHRRLRAADILGKVCLPCLILDVAEEEAAVLSLVSNTTGLPLNPFERAQAEAALPAQGEVGADLARWAAQLSEPRERLAGRQLLLRLTPRERALILAAGMPEEGAIALAGISDPATRLATLEDFCRRLGERGPNGMTGLLQASAAAAKLAGSRKRLLMGDLRLFYNSIDRAVAAVRETGLRVRYDIRDESDRQVIEITLLRDPAEEGSA